MDGGSSPTSNGATADKKANRTAAIRTIVWNFLGLIVPVAILVYWFGGNSTRAWMLGFIWGFFGLPGNPDVSGLAEPTSKASQIVEPASKPPLKLLGHGCHSEYGYQVCEGEVRNETDQRLEDVMAEVTFQDAHGTFVKSESSMIAYQPVMPGQSSPFKVMTSDNPQIRHYRIRFRRLFGGELKASR